MVAIRKITTDNGVSWVIDCYDPQGRRIKKRFPKKAEAEAYLGKVVSSIREGRYEDIFEVKKESQTTFNELADLYVENYQDQKSFYTFKRFIIPVLQEFFGDRRLAQITYLDLETFRNKRKGAITNRGTPRGEARVNREMAVLKHILNKAVEWQLLSVGPFGKGASLLFKENNHRLRFLSEEEVEALLKASSPHLRPIVETALHTGMRSGELLTLKWEQVHNGFIYLKDTKGNKSRQISVNDRLSRVFLELRQRHHLKSFYVFCGSDGKNFGSVKKSFATACTKAGIEDFRFHDLRHTFASPLVMLGVSLKVVQELLGHPDIKLTMRYAHLAPGHLKEAVNSLNHLGSGQKADGKLLGNFLQKGRKGKNRSDVSTLIS